jgi:hypothetical protein
MEYKKGQPPYYDTFNEDDGYTSILFRPGVSVQNRELNEVQSLLRDGIKGVGDALLSDGDIIEGCQVILAPVEGDTIQKKCTVTSGKIYLEGIVRKLRESSIILSGIGVENIGVKIVQEIVDEYTDNGILDVAAGFANYRQSGAHRLKETLSITLNDDSASTLFTIQDGELVNTSTQEDTSVIDRFSATMARRTYDESGNYKVWGLELSSKGITDEDTIHVALSEGKAYILGYEILRDSSSTIKLPRATDLRLVKSEPKIFRDMEQSYKLNNVPVHEITEVTVVSCMTIQMTRGSVRNGSDPIPEIYRPVVDIQSITQPSTGITYVKNQDFMLNADTVNWSLDGNEPEAGESYMVTFTYNKTLVSKEDFDLQQVGEEYYLKLLKESDYKAEMSVTNPGLQIRGIAKDSTMLLDYNFMLYYIATITLDSNGMTRVEKGQSDTLERVTAPNLNDRSVLVLGSVLLTPKNDNLSIDNKNTLRLSMEELQEMVQRIYDLEYNQAITDLDNEAMSGEDAATLKGIYTDGFIGFSKCDVNFNNNNVTFDSAIDLENNELTLSSVSTAHDLTMRIRDDLIPASSAKQHARLISSNCSEKVIATQPYATSVMRINPYQTFPSRPRLSITPKIDNWIETTKATITENITKNVTGQTVINMSYNRVIRGGHFSAYTTTKVTDSTTSVSSKTSSSTATKILESAITYMRQRVINIVGSRFKSHQNNIAVLFDDRQVFATPLNSNYTASKAGYLKADSQGKVYGSIIVPANTKCGTVRIRIYPEDNHDIVAEATYTATGTKRTVQTIVTNTTVNTTTVYQSVLQTTVIDPLAQTFQFEKDQMITSVGLYFCVRDIDNDVIIQIRGVENGYPNAVCYAQKVIDGSECRTSENGTIETKINFDDPIYCEGGVQYCIAILTESPTASMYYSTLGGRDFSTKSSVIKNPYIEGMMFSSSNAITWTAHQSDNLKFNIYGNTFSPKSYVHFTEINDVKYDRLALYASTEVPTDTSLSWEYSSDNGNTWNPISLGSEVELTAIVTNLLVRACVETSRTEVSPVIASDSIELIGYLNNTNCEYISKNIETDREFSTVKQVLEIIQPTGTNVNVYYCVDANGVDWRSATQIDSKVKDANGYIQYTFEDELDSSASNFRARIHLSTNDPCIRPRVRNLMNILK